LKWVFGGGILIAVIIAVLAFTNGWSYIMDFVSGNGDWTGNILLVIINQPII